MVLADPGRDTATGLGFPAGRPALARLAHIRAVLAVRLWLAAGPAWTDGRAWWHSERRLRAAQPAAGRHEHVPDAEIHWPSIEGSPYAGQVWAIEVELTPKPITRTTGIMTGLLTPMQYAAVVYLTAPAARPVVLRAAASCRPGSRPGSRSGTCPPPRSPRSHQRAGGARRAWTPFFPSDPPRERRTSDEGRRRHEGAPEASGRHLMSVWSWLKLTVFLWLLRKMIKGTGWLLLAALAVAVWPVTLVTVAGYAAAWLRGWPPVRLGRAAAAALPTTVIWLVAEGARQHAWQAIALAPVRDWAHGWHHLTAIGVTRTFLLVAPVAIPAGLGLAALLWGWRIYALTTGIGGWLASAPITFDARQWKRQVRTAQGWTAAPGSVPLLARGARIPVGGTIRVIGHRWHPVFTVPHAACARHMVIVGATGSGKTNLMMRLWAGWFTAALAAARAGRDRRPLLVVLDCKGGPDARPRRTAPVACCTGRAPAASRSGPTRRGCPYGIFRRTTWPSCSTR